MIRIPRRQLERVAIGVMFCAIRAAAATAPPPAAELSATAVAPAPAFSTGA